MCTKSSNTGSSCSVSDGSAANSAACACGSVDCESAQHHMFCRQSEEPMQQASPPARCLMDLLPTLQPVLAAAWIASLRATTGMHCYLSKNQCRKIPACSVSDGSAANSAACACGSVDCESAEHHWHVLQAVREQMQQARTAQLLTDLLCQLCSLCLRQCGLRVSQLTPLACFAGARTSAASIPPCSVSDGSAANSAACACGSVDCQSADSGMFCYLSAENQHCARPSMLCV